MNSNIEKIKEVLKDFPELENELDIILNTKKERNEIYIYCLQREKVEGGYHYIPLITQFSDEKMLMACNDLRALQEDYEEEVIEYKLNADPLIILEISFDTYLELSTILNKNLTMTNDIVGESIRKLKAAALLAQVDINEDTLPKQIISNLIKENNYCKCLNEDLEIEECSNYKPLRSNMFEDDDDEDYDEYE